MPVDRSIFQPDWAIAAQRAQGAQGQPFQLVEKEVSYGVQIEDLTRPEFWHVRNGRLAVAQVTLGAVAGERPHWQMIPRGNLNSIAIVGPIVVWSTGATYDIQIGFGDVPDAGVSVPIQPIDERDFLVSGASAMGSAFDVQSGTSAAPLVPIGAVFANVPAAAVGFPLVMKGPYVFTGRRAACLTMIGVTPNLTMRASVYWRERLLLRQEQT